MDKDTQFTILFYSSITFCMIGLFAIALDIVVYDNCQSMTETDSMLSVDECLEQKEYVDYIISISTIIAIIMGLIILCVLMND